MNHEYICIYTDSSNKQNFFKFDYSVENATFEELVQFVKECLFLQDKTFYTMYFYQLYKMSYVYIH